MAILQRLLQKIFKKNPKTLFPGVQYAIEEVFSIGDTVYYTFADLMNCPYERALKTITFYTELSCRVDDEYLEAHIKACDDIFKSEKIDIFKLHKLHSNLSDRRKFIIDTDLIYKLASVVYFDKTEDPRNYDFEYNKKKIARWKQEVSINDFFYSTPVANLIPFLRNSKADLESYSIVQKLIKEEHLKDLSTISVKP